MNMIEVKTSELIGPALDWAVGISDGRVLELPSQARGRKTVVWLDPFVVRLPGRPDFHDNTYRRWLPSTDWADGGPLIDKHHIQTSYNGNYFSQSPTREYWCAYVCKPSGQEERPSGGGPTALIALCRAIVAAYSGDVVSVPAELIGPPK